MTLIENSMVARALRWIAEPKARRLWSAAYLAPVACALAVAMTPKAALPEPLAWRDSPVLGWIVEDGRSWEDVSRKKMVTSARARLAMMDFDGDGQLDAQDATGWRSLELAAKTLDKAYRQGQRLLLQNAYDIDGVPGLSRAEFRNGVAEIRFFAEAPMEDMRIDYAFDRARSETFRGLPRIVLQEGQIVMRIGLDDSENLRSQIETIESYLASASFPLTPGALPAQALSRLFDDTQNACATCQEVAIRAQGQADLVAEFLHDLEDHFAVPAVRTEDLERLVIDLIGRFDGNSDGVLKGEELTALALAWDMRRAVASGVSRGINSWRPTAEQDPFKAWQSATALVDTIRVGARRVPASHWIAVNAHWCRHPLNPPDAAAGKPGFDAARFHLASSVLDRLSVPNYAELEPDPEDMSNRQRAGGRYPGPPPKQAIPCDFGVAVWPRALLKGHDVASRRAVERRVERVFENVRPEAMDP